MENIELVIGERCSGKTWALVKESVETGKHIIARDINTARNLYFIAQELQLDPEKMPHPIVKTENGVLFVPLDNKVFPVPENEEFHVLVDEADTLFNSLFHKEFGYNLVPDKWAMCTELFKSIDTKVTPHSYTFLRNMGDDNNGR